MLTATSYASGQTADSIDAMATRISASTLQTRDDVLAASTELATFGNIGPESFEKILRLAAERGTIARRSALRRMPDVMDIAGAVEFLFSEKARNITGTVMTVDAGSTA